jgi:ABC-type transporter Mla MlaB component
MTLKIENESTPSGTTIRLIGRMQIEHLPELKTQIERSGPMVTLDLEEMSLVDVEAVRFLGECQARGMQIVRCSPYIREWIEREADTG